MANARRGKEVAVAFEGRVDGDGSDAARVSAGRQRRRELLPIGGRGTVSKLMRREIGGLSGRTPPRPEAAFCAEKFRRFMLQDEFPILADIEFPTSLMVQPIKAIIPANDFIFVIDWNGVSVAFHQTENGSVAPYKKGGRIWYFSEHGGNMEALFYNKVNDSIITVCISPFRSGYNMRAIPLEEIRRRQDWGSGIPVFGEWTNNMPIFDSCNNLAVISLCQDFHSLNNIYETNTYQLVHSFPGEIDSITTRPGKMIVAYTLFCNTLPIEVFSTENWIVLEEFSYPMPSPRKKVQFVGLCYENLLLKVKNQNLQVIDLWNHDNVTIIENSEHELPPLSFDLIGNNVLLEFENMVVTCNSCGEQVRLLDIDTRNDFNHSFFHMSVTRDKHFAILYSREPIDSSSKGINNREDSYTGKINICRTFNGKSIMEVIPCDNIDPKAAKRMDSSDEALKNVTAIYYDEEHHRIYTGNASGVVHLWSA